MKLELGSGYHPTPGFVHLDLNPAAPEVDIIGPAFPLDGLPDGSVTELRAVDVLEHISYRDTDAALREWARVLAPGGRVYVQVPDADTIMRWYVNDPGRLHDRIPRGLRKTALMGAAWRLLGGHDDGDNGRDDFRLNAHYSIWSEGSVINALQRVSLTVETITVNDHPNICATAVKR